MTSSGFLYYAWGSPFGNATAVTVPSQVVGVRRQAGTPSQVTGYEVVGSGATTSRSFTGGGGDGPWVAAIPPPL